MPTYNYDNVPILTHLTEDTFGDSPDSRFIETNNGYWYLITLTKPSTTVTGYKIHRSIDRGVTWETVNTTSITSYSTTGASNYLRDSISLNTNGETICVVYITESRMINIHLYKDVGDVLTQTYAYKHTETPNNDPAPIRYDDVAINIDENEVVIVYSPYQNFSSTYYSQLAVLRLNLTSKLKQSYYIHTQRHNSANHMGSSIKVLKDSHGKLIVFTISQIYLSATGTYNTEQSVDMYREDKLLPIQNVGDSNSQRIHLDWSSTHVYSQGNLDEVDAIYLTPEEVGNELGRIYLVMREAMSTTYDNVVLRYSDDAGLSWEHYTLFAPNVFESGTRKNLRLTYVPSEDRISITYIYSSKYLCGHNIVENAGCKYPIVVLRTTPDVQALRTTQIMNKYGILNNNRIRRKVTQQQLPVLVLENTTDKKFYLSGLWDEGEGQVVIIRQTPHEIVFKLDYGQSEVRRASMVRLKINNEVIQVWTTGLTEEMKAVINPKKLVSINNQIQIEVLSNITV